MNLSYLIVPHELSDGAAALVSEILNDLAVVFDSQYFAQIRRYYDDLSERRDIERSCHDGQLDLFDGRRRGVLNPLPHPPASTTTAPVHQRRVRWRTLPHHDRRDHRDHRGAGVRVRSLRATSALRQWGDNVRNRAPLDQK